MSNKGLIVYTFRNARNSDSSNGGPTSKFERFVLVDALIDEVFEARADMPAMFLVRRVIAGNAYIHAVPESLRDQQVMFGGNFVWTSDSRVREINQYPIPVHDRLID